MAKEMCIRDRKNADGTYSYALKLPDVSDVKAEDGNVEHTNLHISNSMVFKANVTERCV